MRAALGHPYVDHELVAFRRWKKLLRHESEEEEPDRECPNPQRHGRDLMAHEKDDDHPVDGLDHIQDAEFLLASVRFAAALCRGALS